MLGGIGGRRRRDDRGWDGWMASLTRWTWAWVNSGSWWWTGRPGVLRIMGSQRVGHDWATDLISSDAILLFIALDLASIISHIHNWVLFLLWLHPFILSGVISPLISSSILHTYRPGEFLFQYPIILPFHTVYGVLKARILKWFAIPFFSGPHSIRPLHHDSPILVGPRGMAGTLKPYSQKTSQSNHTRTTALCNIKYTN